mgnify:CR=1 FL=1
MSISDNIKEYLKKREEEEPESEGEREEEHTTEPTINIEDLSSGQQFRVQGITIRIIEVHKLQFPWKTEYSVGVRLRDGKYESQTFNVTCKDAKDFAEKIKEEVSRYLLLKKMGIKP